MYDRSRNLAGGTLDWEAGGARLPAARLWPRFFVARALRIDGYRPYPVRRFGGRAFWITDASADVPSSSGPSRPWVIVRTDQNQVRLAVQYVPVLGCGAAS